MMAELVSGRAEISPVTSTTSALRCDANASPPTNASAAVPARSTNAADSSGLRAMRPSSRAFSRRLGVAFSVRFSKAIAGVLGYRHLAFDRESGSGPDRLLMDLDQSGPAIGLRIGF